MLQAIPIALMHPLFGRFLHIANGRDGHPMQQDYETAVSIAGHVAQEFPKHDAPVIGVQLARALSRCW